jgi:hypothetical protein
MQLHFNHAVPVAILQRLLLNAWQSAHLRIIHLAGSRLPKRDAWQAEYTADSMRFE